MNIISSDTTYIVELLIGKVDISKVEINTQEDYLVISYKAQNIENKSQDDEFEYLHQEFSQDGFERNIKLPDDASDQISASYSAGLLTISIEKKIKEDAKSIKIEIQN